MLGGFGIGHELRFITLHFVSAKRMNALRPQTAMGHDRYTGPNERGNRFGLLDATLELHRLAASFLQDSPGVFNCPVYPQVEAWKRHIDDHEGVVHCAANHFRMVDHLVECYRQRAVVALYDHRHAVSDQDPLDAGGVHEPCERIVVGRDHRNLLAGGFEAGKLGNRDPLVGHEPLSTGQGGGRTSRQRADHCIVVCVV